MSKLITVRAWHNGRSTDYTASLEHLIEHCFGYTLECGHSWNPRIPERPKTARSLVSALNKSAVERRNYSDTYELVRTPKDAVDRYVAMGICE